MDMLECIAFALMSLGQRPNLGPTWWAARRSVAETFGAPNPKPLRAMWALTSGVTGVTPSLQSYRVRMVVTWTGQAMVLPLDLWPIPSPFV